MGLKKTKERRRSGKLIFVERRKGKAWVYAQLILAPLLLIWLIWLLV